MTSNRVKFYISIIEELLRSIKEKRVQVENDIETDNNLPEKIEMLEDKIKVRDIEIKRLNEVINSNRVPL